MTDGFLRGKHRCPDCGKELRNCCDSALENGHRPPSRDYPGCPVAYPSVRNEFGEILACDPCPVCGSTAHCRLHSQ